ncbi:kinase domain-containing [Fusarium albosuccineum]|uniref:non-specific serine/threonine protein kinase n=1 Tax=Fusarium albosuccineum TaxID=1237068 RepID=A0A8H4L1L4_9HYPO|nr:kinase domain-containing [Fusarium albosuccineum]
MAQNQKADPDLAQLEESKSNFNNYPDNLVRTADFSYTLKEYRDRLTKDKKIYFDDQRKPLIRVWDLVNAQDKKYVESEAIDVDKLKGVLSKTPTDPYRRFLFLRSGSSRSQLDCSQEMMAYLFTFHQVMARFLDFTTTFKPRESPHSFTSFKNEDYLGSGHHQPGLNTIGRSGIKIQHCFNLLAIERSRDSTGWLQRQTAAYHSFDLIQGRALWIILKGDETMRKRFKIATEESIRKEQVPSDNVGSAFRQTFQDHLVILQWCAENWEAYTESLEAKYKDFSGVAEHAPIDDMANDIEVIRKRDKLLALLPGSNAAQQTNGSAKPAQESGIIRRLTSRAATGFSTVTQVDPPSPKIKHHRLEDVVQFDRLQSLSCLNTEVGKAISTIDQNKRVLAEIKEYYRGLVNSAAFKSHISEESILESCKEAASDFVVKIGRLEGDLSNYQGSLKTILRGVERTEAMYNGILQYQSMRTAEYFASASEESADIMQVWTEEMHEKTMSMHVITIFTLIFLPGTFVATIFSSGILTFGEDGSGGFGSSHPKTTKDPKLSSDGGRTATTAPASRLTIPPPPYAMALNSVARIGGQLGQLQDRFFGQDGTGNKQQCYIPLPSLEQFWEHRNVGTILTQHNITQSHAIITESFLGVFSLLVYVDKVNLLDAFVEHSLRDDCFPLTRRPPSWPDTPVYHELFEKIDKWQWIFFPVPFHQHKLHNQVLSPSHILPICTTEHLKNGDTVQVHKIEVNPAYTDPGQTVLVLKTYNDLGKEQYERERKTFSLLQSRPSEHIVGYYGCYQQKLHDGAITYNLILQSVDGGNLEAFYQDMKPPSSLADTAKLWSAFSGVGEGLYHLHHSVRDLDTQTIHQDLKPDNILVSGAPPTQPTQCTQSEAYNISLVIADFGYSHTKVVRNEGDHSGIDSHSGQTYGAPECSHHARYTRVGKNHITSKADIWSLGCIMSDAAVWMKFGQQGREEYRQRRISEARKLRELRSAGQCEGFHNGTEALDAVRTTHDMIRNTDPSDTVTLQVLDMIETVMLVPQSHREDAQTVREQLVRITQPASSAGQIECAAVVRPRPDQHRASFPPSQAPVRAIPSSMTISTTMPTQHEIPNASPVTPTPLSGAEMTETPLNSAPTPTSNQPLAPLRLTQPSSSLTIDEAIEWYENAKRPGRGVDPRVEAVILKLGNNVKGRDHIFFVDNSSTMGIHVATIRNRFKILAYLAKQFDPDGVELYFSSRPSKRHSGDTTRLLTKFSEQQWDQISFEDRMGTFVDEVVIPRLKSWRQMFKFAKPPKPLTIFILTDGQWGVNKRGAAGVEKPIKRLIDEIISKKLSRTQVALQFLRFGHDADGKRYLEYLDRFGNEFECDCVDTKPIDGNIFEMFIGSINSEIDGAGEENSTQ